MPGAHEARGGQASGVRGGGEELPPGLPVLFPGELSGAVRLVQQQAHVHQVGYDTPQRVRGCAGRAQRRMIRAKVVVVCVTICTPSGGAGLTDRMLFVAGAR